MSSMGSGLGFDWRRFRVLFLDLIFMVPARVLLLLFMFWILDFESGWQMDGGYLSRFNQVFESSYGAFIYIFRFCVLFQSDIINVPLCRSGRVI